MNSQRCCNYAYTLVWLCRRFFFFFHFPLLIVFNFLIIFGVVCFGSTQLYHLVL